MRCALPIAVLAMLLAAGCEGVHWYVVDGPPDAGAADIAAVDAGPIVVRPARDAGDDASAARATSLRFANWSPDAPAIDVCLAPHGTAAFAAPVLASRADADGGVAALAAREVTAYFDFAPGAYDVRVVAAGADCATGVLDDVALPAASAGARATVALVGAARPLGAEPRLAVVPFGDDTKSGVTIAVRAIHAAPSLGAVDVGTLTPSIGFGAWFRAIPFGAASRAADQTVDANGYLPRASFTDVTLSAEVVGTHVDTAVASGLSAVPGSVVTFVLVDGVARRDGGAPSPQWLECVDNAGIVGWLASCSLLDD